MKVKKENVERAQDWLTERYLITLMPNSTKADELYFKGALAMAEALGFDYIVNCGYITLLEVK